MNISNVSSTSVSWQNNIRNPWQQRRQDFKSLASALQSGDLNSAQAAFAAWQKDLPGNTSTSNSSDPTSPFGQNSQANADFKSLSDALKSGDVTGAQKAFTTLKTDLRGASQAHRAHHHRKPDNDGDSDDQNQSANSSSVPNAVSDSQTDGSSLNVQA